MGGKYQAYTKYKDYESVFLENIPAVWEVKPLHSLCGFRQGKAHEPFVDSNGEFICVNARFVSTQGGTLKRCNMNLTPAKLFDVLMVMSDLPNGRALARAFFVNDQKNYAVNQRICAITAKNIDAKFLFYQLDRSPYFLMYDDGSNQTHLSNDAFKKYPVLLPSLAEQEKIANFLDHETAKIDTLIEKQQQLIKLLKEKRQAVISHAVTKGLNPNAPLRDSGVEWLGEVPEHWTPLQIRRVLPVMEQGKSPDCENKVAEVHEWGVLKTSCVNNGVYNSDANKTLPNEIAPFPQYEVKNGDILMSRASGSINLIGSVAYVYETRPKILLSDKVFRLHLSSQVNRLFFSYVMRSSFMRSNIGRAISGAEGMANNITKGAVIGFRFALPPLKEQEAITGFISEKVNKLDELVLKSKIAIELIKERRTALISAAVTGKIDVRGWVAPVPPSARDAAQNNQQAAT